MYIAFQVRGHLFEGLESSCELHVLVLSHAEECSKLYLISFSSFERSCIENKMNEYEFNSSVINEMYPKYRFE